MVCGVNQTLEHLKLRVVLHSPLGNACTSIFDNDGDCAREDYEARESNLVETSSVTGTSFLKASFRDLHIIKCELTPSINQQSAHDIPGREIYC